MACLFVITFYQVRERTKMNTTTPTIYKAFETLKSAENYIVKVETKYNTTGLVIEKISNLFYVMAY